MSSAIAQKAPVLVNGVDVTALFGVIDAVKANPEVAKFNFRLVNKWRPADAPQRGQGLHRRYRRAARSAGRR